MKKVGAILFCFIMFSTVVCSQVSASEPKDILVKRTIEVLDSGDTVTTEIYECAIQPRSGKTGYATSTYKNSAGKKIWLLTVTGSFTYNGVTSSATSAEASVSIYDTTANFVSKNAYTSGSTATGTATITYLGSRTTLKASVSCDKDGNLY